MSLTLDRLRALKRQAGATDAAPVAAAADGAARGATSSASDAVGDDARPAARSRSPVLRAQAPWDTVLGDRGAPGSPHGARAAGPTDIGDVPPRAGEWASRPRGDAPATAGRRDPARDSLRRLLGLREHTPAPRPRARAADRSLPGREIDDGLWLIESRVVDAPPGAPLPLAFARRDGHVAAPDLMFFDTETTGLAGGTGTRAFMIGAADWHDDALRIRQLLIANMAAEKAMLREFARWLRPSTVLASYNGRSYDAPLLRTRYRLARLPDALHGLDHLDLLHPSRRRWRGRWDNCRLATIEREALRILREDDLPGSQAPAAWLSFLRGGDAVDLRRVAEHNRQDVATLAQLLIRLCDGSAD